ncbi:hypothetical protein SH1V18_22530 [Vallitalea longa]|uniref:F5/8 type C domain-containing protein n=1 Tax=Vallitalea longa TaxID=2936439 RepID=A0A9W5YEK2_9FIRM|nr:discoidin domain-containing protein [Vallitalea longa]GKX29773.1 hypothetical protein SH1V18_22530 [Vallitalea longa]
MNKAKRTIIYFLFIVLSVGVISFRINLEIHASEENEAVPNCLNNIDDKKTTIASETLSNNPSSNDNTTSHTIKKVYADYHGPRYTREHDGNLGNWKFVGDAKKSSASKHYFAFNGDIIDENGKNQIASTAYPIVGMQSQLDKDYIEYQILLAKIAHIDGFFVEWGFPGHGSDEQLKVMQEIAQKYDFEVGVNWCDAWHMNEWIKRVRPDIKTDEDKIEAAKDSLQYLLDEVYNKPTGALFESHPIIYVFGGGFDNEQLDEIISSVDTPDSILQPWYFRRASMSSKLIGDTVEYRYNATKWNNVINGPFGWIPNRIRDAQESGFDEFDLFATKEDTIEYLKALKDAFIENDNIILRNSVVTPSMDNRGCAGWGTELKMIDRADGQVYEEMWNYNVTNRDYIDTVYIASWNDYTEGHQIEPTVEDGYREIMITEKYAAQLKQITSDVTGVDLPEKIFKLRKRVRKLHKIGFDIDSLMDQLDDVAIEISSKEYNDAKVSLGNIEVEVSKLERLIKTEEHSLKIPSDDITISIPSDKNVAYGKEINTNNDSSDIEYIVDGVTSNNHAWRAINSSEPIWVEINLGDTYNLTNTTIATGIDDSSILRNFKLQYFINGEWINIPSIEIVDNDMASLSIYFESSVTTDRVRIWIDESPDTSIIIREIKLFSNEFPSVEIINPKQNEEYDYGQNIRVTVKANDIDGRIERIDIVDNEIILGTMWKGNDDTFTYEIAQISGKQHNLKAIAYDDEGAKTESNTVVIYPPMENIALNRLVKANASLKNYGPEKAVDGIISLDSRWKTPGNIDEHWLEIDLDEESEIVKAELYMGDDKGWAVRDFELQYWDGMNWNTMPNTKFTNNKIKDMEFEFETPIKTDKVRFYSNEQKGRGVRIKEIKLLAYKNDSTDSTINKHNVEDSNKDDVNDGLESHVDEESNDYDVVNGAFMTFSEQLCDKLRDNYYEGYLIFEYYDDDKKSIKVFSATDRTSDLGDFTYVCSISKTGTGMWKQAKIRLYKENIKLDHSAENDSDLVFRGNGKVRNISLDFNIYSK